jgi:hypothetical protein
MVTGALLLFTYRCNYSQHYVLCAQWVLVLTPDSSSSLLGCSMRVLPPPQLLILLPAWRARPSPIPLPPTLVDPIFLRVQAPTRFLVGYTPLAWTCGNGLQSSLFNTHLPLPRAAPLLFYCSAHVLHILPRF